jgi:hypothetical protein
LTEPVHATIVFAWAPAAADALALVLPAPVAPEVVVLPSSLRRRDSLAALVRGRLRNRGVVTHLLVPANPVAAILPGAGDRWRSVTLAPPDGPPYQIGLPEGLVGAAPRWIVTDVDAVAGRGPYVLDLVARHAHPVHRARMLADRQRADMAVEANLAAAPALCIAGQRLGEGTLVAVTSDPIAGELVALALADRHLARAGDLTGPWEERVVQRATELELGIQVPAQLAIEVAGSPDRAAGAMIHGIASRIGVRMS